MDIIRGLVLFLHSLPPYNLDYSKSYLFLPSQLGCLHHNDTLAIRPLPVTQCLTMSHDVPTRLFYLIREFCVKCGSSNGSLFREIHRWLGSTSTVFLFLEYPHGGRNPPRSGLRLILLEILFVLFIHVLRGIHVQVRQHPRSFN